MQLLNAKELSRKSLIIISLVMILLTTSITYALSRFAIEQEKPNKENTLKLANEAYDRSDFLSASGLYKRYIDKFEPNDLNVKIDYGYSLHNIGKSQEGIQILKSVVQQKPDNAFALFNLAVIYFQQGKKQEAMSWLQQCADKGNSPEISQKALMLLDQMKNSVK